MDTQDVTVTVTDVSELGMLEGMESISYAENGTDAVGTYTTSGPDTATWSLEGADAEDFNISSGGSLAFKTSPDFEAPADADTNNTYMVTVKAEAGGEMDTQDVHRDRHRRERARHAGRHGKHLLRRERHRRRGRLHHERSRHRHLVPGRR